ncbi:TPR end-of-group domain-containing protein [Pseudomarimonas salicorniae]|uniref:TolB amino-terminal domain-containing protein n=1 Tax=Pseudomarimonas salicorniae TaxID=2933270 RepID=A0ABT0GLK5_9GAMM|nr:tetratricopeptide repeat protein [Lysobacter sp. CAU 1642]MCK7595430.1 hypothetical protein [Lysobacter sp. CAU 1642]
MNRPASPSLLSDAWTELRRRKVVRAAGAYAVTAFVVLQLAEITFEPLGLPPRALTWTILAAILGFPLVLVVSWYFDLGPRGMTRDRNRAQRAGAVFAMLLVLLTTAGLGLWLVGIYEREDAGAAASTAAHDAPDNSVAVLPFDDMSAERDQSYLAEGIAEELLDRLAQNRALRVAARTSSFALRAQGLDARQMGETLGVRWLLEGSVRKAGSRLRITAQLIDTRSGFHQWSQTYERDDGDLFALQDEVSEAIAATLNGLIGGEALAAVEDSRALSSDPAALQAFLAGRQQWRLRTAAGLAAAIELFREAVERDAEFARAWSGLADAYLLQANYGFRPVQEALALAEPAAVRAVSLAPDLGEAWASLGLLRSIAGQLEAAERSLREAMRLDPRYEMAPMWLADVLGRGGRFDAQLDVLRQAQALNPLEPIIGGNLAQSLALHGRFEEAEAVLQRLLAVTPESTPLLRTAADIALQRGQLARAWELAERAEASDPGAPATLETRIHVLLLLGAADRAEQLLAALPQGSLRRLAARQWTALYADPPRWLPEVREGLAGLEAERGEEARFLRLLSAWAALVSGEREAARRQLQGLADQPGGADPQHFEITSLLAALGGDGASDSARWCEEAARWQQLGSGSTKGQVAAAAALSLCGESDPAMLALERAVAAGFSDARQAAADPRFAALRKTPRFAELLAQMRERVAAEREQAGL